MSFIQKLVVAVLPRRWAESIEAHSRSWIARCACGHGRSVWELGGIRWLAAGNPRRLIYCPHCGRNTWHKISREAHQATDEPPA